MWTPKFETVGRSARYAWLQTTKSPGTTFGSITPHLYDVRVCKKATDDEVRTYRLMFGATVRTWTFVCFSTASRSSKHPGSIERFLHSIRCVLGGLDKPRYTKCMFKSGKCGVRITAMQTSQLSMRQWFLVIIIQLNAINWCQEFGLLMIMFTNLGSRRFCFHVNARYSVHHGRCKHNCTEKKISNATVEEQRRRVSMLCFLPTGDHAGPVARLAPPCHGRSRRRDQSSAHILNDASSHLLFPQGSTDPSLKFMLLETRTGHETSIKKKDWSTWHGPYLRTAVLHKHSEGCGPHLHMITVCGVALAKQPDIPLEWAEGSAGSLCSFPNEVDDTEGRDREQVSR